mmetsp:Transcript_17211/g.39910  ORF Transcript_17211/g.39910 Transcript_17211/m.39910 type:complete len:233 (-) Transcript_17211:424-1122(-)
MFPHSGPSETPVLLLFWALLFFCIDIFAFFRFLRDRIFHVQVTFVKKVQTNIPIFSTTRKGSSIGINGQGIDRSKVSLDGPKFFFVDEMEKARFEFSHLACSCGYSHGLLSTSQQNVILRFGQHCIIHGSVRLVGLVMFQVDRIEKFGSKVGRAGQEESLVLVESDPVDLFLMRHDLFHFISCLWIVQTQCTIVKSHQQAFIQRHPSNIGGIHALVEGMILRQIDLQPRIFR